MTRQQWQGHRQPPAGNRYTKSRCLPTPRFVPPVSGPQCPALFPFFACPWRQARPVAFPPRMSLPASVRPSWAPPQSPNPHKMGMSSTTGRTARLPPGSGIMQVASAGACPGEAPTAAPSRCTRNAPPPRNASTTGPTDPRPGPKRTRTTATPSPQPACPHPPHTSRRHPFPMVPKSLGRIRPEATPSLSRDVSPQSPQRPRSAPKGHDSPRLAAVSPRPPHAPTEPHRARCAPAVPPQSPHCAWNGNPRCWNGTTPTTVSDPDCLYRSLLGRLARRSTVRRPGCPDGLAAEPTGVAAGPAARQRADRLSVLRHSSPGPCHPTVRWQPGDTDRRRGPTRPTPTPAPPTTLQHNHRARQSRPSTVTRPTEPTTASPLDG